MYLERSESEALSVRFTTTNQVRVKRLNVFMG
jgi:hypothetical protein